MESGIKVKVNTVLIPTINGSHVQEIAERMSGLGVFIQNIVPLIPLYKFESLPAPTCRQLKEARERCEQYIKQWRLCKLCRADSCGIVGFEMPSSKVLYEAYPEKYRKLYAGLAPAWQEEIHAHQ